MKVRDIEVHPKVWGEEHWIVNDDGFNYCGKKLCLKKKFRCSLHEHRVKAETFYVIKGCVVVEDSEGWEFLKTGDAYTVPVGSIHRFNGIEDSEIIEFSTFHREEDSYRKDGQLSGEIPDELFEKMLKESNSSNR
jgi:quercetin dioxygenase-like cupin family protein